MQRTQADEGLFDTRLDSSASNQCCVFAKAMDCRKDMAGAIPIATVLFKMCEKNVRSKQCITIE